MRGSGFGAGAAWGAVTVAGAFLSGAAATGFGAGLEAVFAAGFGVTLTGVDFFGAGAVGFFAGALFFAGDFGLEIFSDFEEVALGFALGADAFLVATFALGLALAGGAFFSTSFFWGVAFLPAAAFFAFVALVAMNLPYQENFTRSTPLPLPI